MFHSLKIDSIHIEPIRGLLLKDADIMANSADHGKFAYLGAESILFAWAHNSESSEWSIIVNDEIVI